MSDDQVTTQDTPLGSPDAFAHEQPGGTGSDGAQIDESDDWLESAEELPRRPRRRLLTPIPLALIGVLLIACGFIGGVLVEKGQTGSSASATSGGLAARLAGLRGAASATGGTSATATSAPTFSGGQAGARRFGGGPSAGGGVTVGQVAYVEGHTLYVESAEGNTVKVITSAASTVTKTQTSSVKSIHPGETVFVQRAANKGGTVTASSISVGGGAGGLGRGLGGLFGGGGATEGARNGGGARNNASGSSEGPTLFGK